MHASAASFVVSRSWRSVARLKRGGMMLVVAACKAALLLAMLESSGLAVESSAEVAECLDLELAQLTESEGGLLRRAVER